MHIGEILSKSKVIAVVGLSDNGERASYRVASYLLEQGYTIIPVNPKISQWKGIPAYASLSQVRETVDIIDIFRKSEFVSDIVDEAITLGASVIWMQLGVADEEAAKKARNAGLTVVMDRCLKIEHQEWRKSIKRGE
jgi:predicted CoA-binding protein